MSPHTAISDVVFEAFLQCEMKAYLLLKGATATDPEIADCQQAAAYQFQKSCSERLRRITLEAQCHTGMPPLDALKERIYRVILDPLISASDIHTQLHALVRVATRRGADGASYSPIRFVPHEKLAPSDKLLIAFDALAVSRVTGHIPRVGKIVHGSRYVSVTVPLSRLSGKAQSSLTRLAAWQENTTPPPLILNKHCPACQFRSRCRQVALENDDLSLLSNIGEKERRKLNHKGIFTISQLSYTFRPRRYSFRKASRPPRHDPALKALAIRKNQVHVIGTLTFSVPENAVYLDVEGVPDRNFYYLIGLRYKSGGAWVHRSFWADTESDEKQTWASFLHALALLGNPQLVHYGNYETRFLKRMKTRYSDATGDVEFSDRLISSSRNLLSLTYAQVYFPTYSNSLKDIARHLGFRWSDDAASGLRALIWRSQWESCQEPDLKRRLLTYNAEDCEAVQRVAEALGEICLPRTEARTPGLEPVDASLLLDKYKRMFRPLDCAIPLFKQINNASYWDYQRSKVYVRCNERIRRLIRKEQKRTLKFRKKPAINKTIDVSDTRPTECPQCGSHLIHITGRRTQITSDITFSVYGPRRKVFMYCYNKYRCRGCNKVFNKYKRRTKYGAGLCAYVAYLLLEMKISQGKACKHLREVFSIHVSGRGLNRIKAGIAEQNKFTYERLLEKIATGKLVHADETKVVVAGESRYVWVFTNLEEVAFVYGGSREAGIVQEVLRGFEGVLVTDFYAGYDSIACTQQKCLIHLLRDINEDLLKNPFNKEMEHLGQGFASLLQRIVETIDCFGLKAYYLKKHKRDVDVFYKMILSQNWQSEVATAYRDRFERNRSRLFTFLEYDGVPWNNNNAEHAVKSFVRVRNVIGANSTPKGLNDYLVLLSICETCKYKGVSFLEFLRSGKVDIDAFASQS